MYKSVACSVSMYICINTIIIYLQKSIHFKHNVCFTFKCFCAVTAVNAVIRVCLAVMHDKNELSLSNNARSDQLKNVLLKKTYSVIIGLALNNTFPRNFHRTNDLHNTRLCNVHTQCPHHPCVRIYCIVGIVGRLVGRQVGMCSGVLNITDAEIFERKQNKCNRIK